MTALRDFWYKFNLKHNPNYYYAKKKTEKIKIESRIALLEAMISKNDRDREAVEEKINAEKDGAAEREKRDIRKTGERPKTAKEKREESAVLVEEETSVEGEE